MFLLIDTANLKAIEEAVETFPLAGVTTCPTIIVRECRTDFFQILKDIRSIIGPRKMLHAQVLGREKQEIFRDAIAMREKIDGEFYPKLPVTMPGLQAMAMLHREGIAFTATAIHTSAQAFLAAEQGASYLAPYVNRIDNAGNSGAQTVREIAEFLKQHELPAKILAASFRNVRQITDVILAGAHTVTLSPDLVWKMAECPQTELAVAKFRADWDGFYGKDKSVHNL